MPQKKHKPEEIVAKSRESEATFEFLMQLGLEDESRRHIHWNRNGAEFFARAGDVLEGLLRRTCRSASRRLTGRSSGLRGDRRNYQQSGDLAAGWSSHHFQYRNSGTLSYEFPHG